VRRRYTLQGRETPAKCHGTYVLSFERHEEASRFAMLLQVAAPPRLPQPAAARSSAQRVSALRSAVQAQGFDMPTATVWGVEQLSEFCSMAEFGLGFVPHDALLIPPQHNYFDADAFEKLQEARRAPAAATRHHGLATAAPLAHTPPALSRRVASHSAATPLRPRRAGFLLDASQVEAEWESDGAELRARLDRLFEQ
jgi:hypothetical protein